MKCCKQLLPGSNVIVVPALRAALIAAGLVSQAALAQQVQTAGDLFVNVDATQSPEGPLPSIANTGTLGGVFAATGDDTTVPVIATAGGTKGIQMDGNDYLQIVTAVGGDLIVAPDGLVGEDPTRSIEVWAINPSVGTEETLVSWSHRGGPDGSNISFGYGSDFRWGAVGHWGGDGPDLGWSNDGGNPEPNKWHYLVYTLDGTVSHVYVDGASANGEILNPGTINTYGDTPINIGTQLEPDGVTPTAGLRYSGTIARVRVHDGVLTPEQIAANYELEKSAFIDPEPAPPPPPVVPERLSGGPSHRYTFSETAAADASGLTFKDSVGTADGLIQGAGAAFTGSRLQLPGGAVTDASYGDLPNGLLSENSTNNGGTGEFTFEGWVKVTGARTWSRIFDFGSSDTLDGTGEVLGPEVAGNGLDYLFYSAQVGDDVNTRRLEVRNNDGAAGVDIVTGDVSTRTFNTDTHVVVTWKESTGQVIAYENGVTKGSVTTVDAMSDINDVNIWLGRSNYSADQDAQIEFDDVRLYDSVLTPGQVLGNYFIGPDSLNDHDFPVTITGQPASIGTVPNFPVEFSVTVLGSTPISFQWYRDGNPITGATNQTYSIPSASAADNGAKFTVQVSNTVNGTPSTAASDPATLTVPTDTVTLKHRYSFDGNANGDIVDSVGGKNGVALGNFQFQNGELVLDGSDLTYGDLPNGIITDLGDNATIELWVTYAGGPNWARVFDFGTSTGGEDVSDGGADVDYLFFTSKTAQGFPRFEANFPDGGVTTVLNHPGAMPVNQEEHLVITYSYTGNRARMYTNGAPVSTATATVPKPLSAMNNRDVNVWLGRSQFPDPFWSGKYNELRIYQGAMTAEQVAASFLAGPNSMPAEAPELSVARDGTNVKITFTGTLESATAVTGPWAPVAGATSPATYPATTGQTFYRSKE